MGNSQEILSYWEPLRDFIEAFPFYVMIVDETHHVLMANEAVSKDLGIESDKIIGTFCPKAVHGLDSPYPGCPVEKAAAKNCSVVKEMFFEEHGKWYRSAAYLIKGKTTSSKRLFVHMIQDIDKDKRAEEEMQGYIEELEKWQKMAVNRELKMVELKNEIEALKARLRNIKDH